MSISGVFPTVAVGVESIKIKGKRIYKFIIRLDFGNQKFIVCTRVENFNETVRQFERY